MLSLFVHPRKMRRRCLDNLQMPTQSETSRSEEDDASEGDEATGFHIRRGDNLQPVRSTIVLSFAAAWTASSLSLHAMHVVDTVWDVFAHLHSWSKPCVSLAACIANVKDELLMVAINFSMLSIPAHEHKTQSHWVLRVL